VPTKVSATELTVSVATPKSHNLMFPRELTKTFDGLMSRCMIRWFSYRYTKPARIDSVILPSTSIRTGPNSLEMRSRELHLVSCIRIQTGSRLVRTHSPYIPYTTQYRATRSERHRRMLRYKASCSRGRLVAHGGFACGRSLSRRRG
jgi:hypothetical protein